MSNVMFTPPAPSPLDALAGERPTWRMTDAVLPDGFRLEPAFEDTVALLGHPARAALDARIQPLPEPTGPVVEGQLDEQPAGEQPTPTGPIGVVEPDGATAARSAPKKPAAKRAPRGRAAS